MITCSESILPRGGPGRRLCSRKGRYPLDTHRFCRQHWLLYCKAQEAQRLAAEEFERAYPGGVAEFQAQMVDVAHE